MFHYKTKGTCSREILLDIEDGMLKEASFEGGCMGNTSGISQLVRNRSVDEIIGLLEGIECGSRGTSCPDQLAQALKTYKKNGEEQEKKQEA